LEFADCWVCINGDDFWVKVEGDFQLTPRRLIAIDYPAGGTSAFDYYDSSPIDVNFREFVDPEAYPRIKSDYFNGLGRDPYFINMVTKRWKRNELDQLVSTDELYFSWMDADDYDLGDISSEDRFYSTRRLIDPSNPDSSKEISFEYCYFSEPGIYSRESRDRGWLVKQLSSKEMRPDGGPIVIPELEPEVYGEEFREVYNFWNTATMLLDSTRSFIDGVESCTRYDRVFLNESDPKVSNILQETEKNAFGI
jgi:hypothetical protein